jgi:hypothetical protein
MRATLSRRQFAFSAALLALGGAGLVREALAADRLHYLLLAAAIGADAPSESDFSIGFPRRTFGSRARLLAVGARIKRTLVGLNLGATESISDLGLRALTARIAASEAAHLSYLSSLAGGAVLGAGDAEGARHRRSDGGVGAVLGMIT